MKCICGIDPGKDGALVSLIEGDEPVYMLTRSHFTAMTGKGARTDYRPDAMARALRGLKKGCDEIEVFLERQGANVVRRKGEEGKKEGSVSSFSTGYGFGLWVGVLAALEIPFYIVHPATWVAAVLKDAQGEGKARAIFVAGRLLPALDLVPKGCRVPHSGLADSACLAIYGRDHYHKSEK